MPEFIPVYTEHEIQSSVIAQCDYWGKKQWPQLLLFMAIPNGTFIPANSAKERRTAATIRAKLTREGMKKGAPDLFNPMASWDGKRNCLLMETKKPGEKPTPEQKLLHKMLKDIAGIEVFLYDNKADGLKIINSHFNINIPI